MNEKNKLYLLLAGFLAIAVIPFQNQIFQTSLISSFTLLQEYAREHTLTCIVPAFFIAGLLTLTKKEVILSLLGPKANKIKAYLTGSFAGGILSVCSCTILPLFASIRKNGAGLGPATTFLFAGPAINITAALLTISVLGIEIGAARIIAAISLAIIIGLIMSLIFKEDLQKANFHIAESDSLKAKQLLILIGLLIAIMIITSFNISLTALILGPLFLALLITIYTYKYIEKTKRQKWMNETWNFTKLIAPYLIIGIALVGFLMPIIPETYVTKIAGQNTITSNLAIGILSSLMYISTLTEVPIVQGLLELGMHKGPALTLLLAGPTISLPNLLVINKILGTKKTMTYVALTLILSSVIGLTYGYI